MVRFEFVAVAAVDISLAVRFEEQHLPHLA